MLKNFFLFFIFYILALLESSFLPHFTLIALFPDLIFIAIFFLIFLDSKSDRFLPVFFGGFLLDLYSGGIFGLKTFNLLLVATFLDFILAFIRKRNLFWLIFTFFTSFLFYESLLLLQKRF